MIRRLFGGIPLLQSRGTVRWRTDAGHRERYCGAGETAGAESGKLATRQSMLDTGPSDATTRLHCPERLRFTLLYRKGRA